MKLIENTLESPLKKIVYFSDGSAAQYKHRENYLICYNEGFGVPADWHFFATSHGKSACEGVGGTLKRFAAKASMQQPYNDTSPTV
jgi:hypothetical protein